MTTPTLPEPLVPAYIDLRNFGFMPLDVDRLLKSEKWIEAADHPYLGHAMMSLWAASWHEVPAGSLPNKAKILARHSHRTLEEFATIAAEVMAGWVMCSDGRLYHPVVCEKALEAWEQKQKFKARTTNATKAKIAKAKAPKPAEERHDDRNGERDEPRNDDEQTGTDLEQSPPNPPEGESDEGLNPVEVLEQKKLKRRKARKRIGLTGEGEFSPGFIAFWEAYPKKVGKQVAWEAWERDELEEFGPTLIRDVRERTAKDDRWLRGFAPDPSTYLNQRRWTDAVVGPKPQDAPARPAATFNPGGTSPKVLETPQRKLEGAIGYALAQKEHNDWTDEQIETYLKPYRDAAHAADPA